MAEWESSYGGRYLRNARLLTEEEINERYPIQNTSRRALLTRKAVEKGYDILYGESPRPQPGLGDDFEPVDILVTAAYLYGTIPEWILTGAFTDMSTPNAIYAAVKLKYKSN